MAYDAAYVPAATASSNEVPVSSFYKDPNTPKYDASTGVYFGNNEEDDDIQESDESPVLSHHKNGKFNNLLWNIKKSVSQVVYLIFRLLYHGKNMLTYQRHISDINRENSSLLRFLCFIGGLVMTISSIIFILNIMLIITNPYFYILQIYQGAFGAMAMIVEAKDWDCLDKFKPIIVYWFRFLTIPLGKSVFYIFVGVLNTSMWWLKNIFALAIGVYMTFLGLITFFIHAGSVSQIISQYRNNMQNVVDNPNVCSMSMPMNGSRIPGISSLKNNDIMCGNNYTDLSPCAAAIINSPEFIDDEEDLDDDDETINKFEPYGLHKYIIQDHGSRNETTTATDTGLFYNQTELGTKNNNRPHQQPFSKRKN